MPASHLSRSTASSNRTPPSATVGYPSTIRAVVSGSFLIPKYSAAVARHAMPANDHGRPRQPRKLRHRAAQQNGNQYSRGDGIKLHQRVAPDLAFEAMMRAEIEACSGCDRQQSDGERRIPALRSLGARSAATSGRTAPRWRRSTAGRSPTTESRQTRCTSCPPAPRMPNPLANRRAARARTIASPTATARKKKYSGQMRRMRRT